MGWRLSAQKRGGPRAKCLECDKRFEIDEARTSPLSTAGMTGLYRHIPCTDLPKDPWEIIGMETLPPEAAVQAKMDLLVFYGDLPQGWPSQARPTPTPARSFRRRATGGSMAEQAQDPEQRVGDTELDHETENSLPATVLDGTAQTQAEEQQDSFEQSLLWWNTLQPRDLLEIGRAHV